MKGKAEKWVIQKCLSARGLEDLSAKGSAVCTGDIIALYSLATDMMLAMVDIYHLFIN